MWCCVASKKHANINTVSSHTRSKPRIEKDVFFWNKKQPHP